MAGVEHQCNGVGAFRRDLGRELTDLFAHIILRQIGRTRHVEPGVAKQF